MRSIQQLVLLAAFARLSYTADVCKHHQNSNPNPSGNPTIQPAVNDQVPLGLPYEIKWTVRIPFVVPPVLY